MRDTLPESLTPNKYFFLKRVHFYPTNYWTYSFCIYFVLSFFCFPVFLINKTWWVLRSKSQRVVSFQSFGKSICFNRLCRRYFTYSNDIDGTGSIGSDDVNAIESIMEESWITVRTAIMSSAVNLKKQSWFSFVNRGYDWIYYVYCKPQSYRIIFLKDHFLKSIHTLCTMLKVVHKFGWIVLL